MSDRTKFSLDEQIACARREVKMRQSMYPKWVSLRRMAAHTAEIELGKMQAIVETLEGVLAVQERLRELEQQVKELTAKAKHAPEFLSQALNEGSGVCRP